MKYKYMYSIGYKLPGDNTVFSSWYGGNTEQEAKNKAKDTALEFYDKYHDRKLILTDINIVECKNVGDYESVLFDLSHSN